MEVAASKQEVLVWVGDFKGSTPCDGESLSDACKKKQAKKMNGKICNSKCTTNFDPRVYMY